MQSFEPVGEESDNESLPGLEVEVSTSPKEV